VDSIASETFGIFNLPNPFSRTTALGSSQPLRDTGTRDFAECKRRPALKADSLIAICEPIL
jgi:hypothetical protein